MNTGSGNIYMDDLKTEELRPERVGGNRAIHILEFSGAVAYVPEEGNLEDVAQFKIMQNTAADCTVRCIPELRNGKKEFFYLTGGLRKFSEAAATMSSGEFIAAVQQILAAFRSIDSTGFLSVRNLEVSADRIYLEPKSWKPRLLYVPVKNPLSDTEHEAETVLKREIGELIRQNPNLRISTDITCLEEYINSDLSIAEYLQTHGSAESRGQVQGIKQEQHPAGQASGRNTDKQPDIPGRLPTAGVTGRALQLTGEKDSAVAFTVNRTPFVIGKKSSEVDGTIAGSRQISRIHCEITQQAGIWYVKDRNSSNGTFLNGDRIQPGVPAELHDGDLLKLADVGFKILFH